MHSPYLAILALLLMASHSAIADKVDKLSKKAECEKKNDETRAEKRLKADCFFEIKEYDQSIKLMQEVIAQNPKDVESFFISSFLQWTKGQEAPENEREHYNTKALEDLNRANVLNPTDWRVYMELGDFYYLRLKSPERAFRYYMLSREHYEGDQKKEIPKASQGQKSAIENRIARTNEDLDRRGAAVSATCLSLHWDPDNSEAQSRLERLAGSCKRKNFRTHITNIEK